MRLSLPIHGILFSGRPVTPGVALAQRVQQHSAQLYLPRPSTAHEKGAAIDLIYLPRAWRWIRLKTIERIVLRTAMWLRGPSLS